jgi:hypothetical protein
MIDTIENHSAAVGRFAWVMAWFGLVAGQLHALSRHATASGQEDLAESPWTRAWSEPASDLLSPLLGWADPDLVYVTYGKLWVPVFLAFFLCALVTYRRRDPRGFERGAWRVMLVCYAAAVVTVFLEYWTQWTGEPDALLDLVFYASLPVVLLTLVGSTVLGVTLLRKRFRPSGAAWLLAATFPAAFLILSVTSMGSVVLPISFAFGIVGRRLARERAQVAVPAAPSPVKG